MSRRDRIFKILLFVLGGLASVFFLVTKNTAWLERAVGPDYRFGDLYSLNKIAVFKPAQPLTFGKDKDIDSIDRGETPGQNQLYFFGDSFGFADFGESTFWLQLSRKIGQPIFAIYNHSHTDLWQNPYRFFDTFAPDAQQKRKLRVVIYEIAERQIDSQFAVPIPETKPSRRSPSRPPVPLSLKRLYFNLLFHTETRHELLFKHNFVTRPFLAAWNTTIFRLFGRVSPETPLYSLNPPFLFFRDAVASFRTTHDKAAIDNLADNIARFERHLLERYNCSLRLVLVPNKISLYHKLVTTERYDDFLPRLQMALESRGVQTVEFFSRFRQETELLYWPSDTHWNCRGIRMGVEETLRVWPSLGPKTDR
jgi:acetyltransferase AlgX (SGNH hydrolase-like protein)